MEHEWSLDGVDRKFVKKQLSEYSLTNRAEFEAELNSAILSGKVFSEDILSLSHMKQTKQLLPSNYLTTALERMCVFRVKRLARASRMR